MNPEQIKYERLWKDHQAYRTVAPGELLADHFLSLAHPQAHHRVIDFGCGTGRGALRIATKSSAMVTAIDFVEGCVDPDVHRALERDDLQFRQHDLTKPLDWQTKPADFGYCTDVLEHIPPEDVDTVLKNILSAARRVYLCISTVEDKMGALIGEPLHLTVRPAQWWREKLEQDHQCRVMHFQDMGGAVIVWCSAFATFDDFEHRTMLNVEIERIRKNIHANLDLGLKELAPYEAQDTEIMLLAGGPSLADHEDEIRHLHRVGGMPIVTVNGAYNWAIEKGLAPGLQVIVDAREFNRRFTTPVLPQCVYAVSSQCDPELTRSLPRDQVLLWHGAGDEVREIIVEHGKANNINREYYPVNGGTTVTLRALPLLAMIGFRRINVYGFDSCIRPGAHHAYPQPENDADGIIPISVNGRDFWCAGWQVKQAQEFSEVVKHILAPVGVELAVHGDGLIATIIEAAAAASEE